jgi:hypothetical protein
MRARLADGALNGFRPKNCAIAKTPRGASDFKPRPADRGYIEGNRFGAGRGDTRRR